MLLWEIPGNNVKSNTGSGSHSNFKCYAVIRKNGWNAYAVVWNDKKDIYTEWFQLYFKKHRAEKPSLTLTDKKILRWDLKGTELKMVNGTASSTDSPWFACLKIVFYIKPELECL